MGVIVKHIHLYLVFTCCYCLFCISACVDPNIVKDPSFEEMKSPYEPGHWYISMFNTETGTTEFELETGNARSGNNHITIINNRDNHARLIQNIPVAEGKSYRLSCWIRTENVGMETKGANISEESVSEISPDIKGTNDRWQYTELYLKTGTGITDISVSLNLGGYWGVNTGRASFDDVTVEEVAHIPVDARVAVKGGPVAKKERKEPEPAHIPVKEPENMQHETLFSLILGCIAVIFISAQCVSVNLCKKRREE
jgi:hypothetical protein